MFLDARDAATPDMLETDVAIIGSGAAGLAVALRLIERGITVLVIEAGGEKVSAASQELYRAASIAPDNHGPVHMYRRRAYGGSTAIWGGRCIPFDPIDLEAREWIPYARWPIDHATLAAYYPAAAALCRAGAPIFHAEEALPGEPPEMVPGRADPDLLLDRIERFSEPTHFGAAYRRTLMESPLATVLLNASAVEILTDDAGNVANGVALRAPGGRDIRVTAATIVLAAGAIETPRLLLASSRTRSGGLGNAHDLVGRFYQSHLEGEAGEIVFDAPPAQVLLDYQRDAQGIYCRRYLWLSPEAQRRERLAGLILRPHHVNIVDPAHGDPVLSAMYLVKNFIVAEYGRKMTSTEQAVLARHAGGRGALYAAHARNVLTHLPRLSAFGIDWLRRRTLARRKLPSVVLRDARNRYMLELNAEQTPNSQSRVTLAGERDALGLPRVAIDWRTTGQDREMLAGGLIRMRDAMTRHGGGRLTLSDTEAHDHAAAATRVGGHHIGTARMAASPTQGVVDSDCALFGTANLYVAGASTFPTSGFANPTFVLVALALRLADHLGKRHGRA